MLLPGVAFAVSHSWLTMISMCSSLIAAVHSPSVVMSAPAEEPKQPKQSRADKEAAEAKEAAAVPGQQQHDTGRSRRRVAEADEAAATERRWMLVGCAFCFFSRCSEAAAGAAHQGRPHHPAVSAHGIGRCRSVDT